MSLNQESSSENTGYVSESRSGDVNYDMLRTSRNRRRLSQDETARARKQHTAPRPGPCNVEMCLGKALLCTAVRTLPLCCGNVYANIWLNISCFVATLPGEQSGEVVSDCK